MKTIAEHMRDVLVETENKGFMWGDLYLMDMCAARCTHTTLLDAHPIDRHKRIMDACGRSPLFDAGLIRVDVPRGNKLRRAFDLKEAAGE